MSIARRRVLFLHHLTTDRVERFEGLLRDAGYEVRAQEAHRPLREPFDVVVFDVAVADRHGLMVLRDLGAHSDAAHFLVEPIELPALLTALERTIEREHPDEPPGLSSVAPRVRDDLSIAPTDPRADEAELEALVDERERVARRVQVSEREPEHEPLRAKLAWLDREITARAQLMRLSR